MRSVAQSKMMKWIMDNRDVDVYPDHQDRVAIDVTLNKESEKLYLINLASNDPELEAVFRYIAKYQHFDDPNRDVAISLLRIAEKVDFDFDRFANFLAIASKELYEKDDIFPQIIDLVIRDKNSDFEKIIELVAMSYEPCQIPDFITAKLESVADNPEIHARLTQGVMFARAKIGDFEGLQQSINNVVGAQVTAENVVDKANIFAGTLFRLMIEDGNNEMISKFLQKLPADQGLRAKAFAIAFSAAMQNEFGFRLKTVPTKLHKEEVRFDETARQESLYSKFRAIAKIANDPEFAPEEKKEVKSILKKFNNVGQSLISVVRGRGYEFRQLDSMTKMILGTNNVDSFKRHPKTFYSNESSALTSAMKQSISDIKTPGRSVFGAKGDSLLSTLSIYTGRS